MENILSTVSSTRVLLRAATDNRVSERAQPVVIACSNEWMDSAKHQQFRLSKIYERLWALHYVGLRSSRWEIRNPVHCKL